MAKLSFKTKLLLLCLFFSVINIIGGLSAYKAIHHVQADFRIVAGHSLPSILYSNQMYLNFQKTRISLRTLGMPGLPKSEALKAAREARAAITNYEITSKKYHAMNATTEQKAINLKVQEKWEMFKTIGLRILEIHESEDTGKYEKIIAIFLKECPEASAAFEAAMIPLLTYLQNESNSAVTESEESATLSIQVMAGITLVGLFTGLVLGFIFAKVLTKKIQTLSEELTLGSQKVTSASKRISNTATELSHSSTEQASSLEETVATMEEMTSMVKLNSENAQLASVKSQEACEKAFSGEKDIQTLIQSIREIAADSRRIEEIISVIDDIAFQTNLLALNAAVEAARAGEQGRGFAVVADAVRALAQRSAVAAKDISNLIKSSVTKIDYGNQAAIKGGRVLHEILDSIKSVSELNQQISMASQDQSTGISQISLAMNQLDETTQKNAGASQAAATASHELSEQAIALRRSVGLLQELIEGSSAFSKSELKSTYNDNSNFELSSSTQVVRNRNAA